MLEATLFGERRQYARARAAARPLGREAGRPRAGSRDPSFRGRRALDALAGVARPAARRDSAASPTAAASSSCTPISTPARSRPDAPAEIADAVSAIRLTTSAALAAGPVLFETLDGRPFGVRPVLPIAATQPPGEPSRLDAFRTPIAVEVLGALGQGRRRPRARRGARSLGALALPERAVPGRAAACLARARSSARPGRCAARCSSRWTAGARGAARRSRRARGRGRREHGVRGCRTAGARGGAACARSSRARARARPRAPRPAAATAAWAALSERVSTRISAQRRFPFVTPCGLRRSMDEARAVWSDWSGSRRSTGPAPGAGRCCPSCEHCSGRRKHGRARKEVMPERVPSTAYGEPGTGSSDGLRMT